MIKKNENIRLQKDKRTHINITYRVLVKSQNGVIKFMCDCNEILVADFIVTNSEINGNKKSKYFYIEL